MKVQEVMHPGAVLVEIGAPLREIARRMRDQDIGAIPVSSRGRVVGIVTDRDIACRAFADSGDPAKMTAKDVMSRDVVCCSPDDDISIAIRAMEQHRVRRLPVIDVHNAMVGMLSLGDVSSQAGKDLSGELLQAVSAHHP
jgi:CBS domain-containing protein